MRRRLQLGEWLSSFLVVIGAGHGSSKELLGFFEASRSAVLVLFRVTVGGRAKKEKERLGCGFWF